MFRFLLYSHLQAEPQKVLYTISNAYRVGHLDLHVYVFNLLKPNDIYICRTAALTSRRYILNI